MNLFDASALLCFLKNETDAAVLWRQGSVMSLADRIAVATAHRLGATAWTADKLWGTDPPVRQVR